MAEFKFQVGQLVTLKAVLADCQKAAEVGTVKTPNAAMVVERMSQECPGGVQHHYALARCGETFRANEIELIDFAEVDVAGLAKAAKAGRQARRDDERSAWDFLNLAKEDFVSEQWFDAAAKVRDLKDELLKVWEEFKKTRDENEAKS